MRRYFYESTIAEFLVRAPLSILGELAANNEFELLLTSRDSWERQIEILKNSLEGVEGDIYFEYSIPRMGRRIDTVLVTQTVVFVIEFKVGQTEYLRSDIDQVYDYALDLKNFHEKSHASLLVPILVATEASGRLNQFDLHSVPDHLIPPLLCNGSNLGRTISDCLTRFEGGMVISDWIHGRYSPTPTIVEAAAALYGEHEVEDISRSDAGATNLRITSSKVSEIIERANRKAEKAICFVTGVPGAGKTLVGLDIATKHNDPDETLYSVFLSGNGPLVSVLHEALARDAVRISKERGGKLRKKEAASKVKKFIQNVHHFRDECLRDQGPPIEHVALFDEAQRAWDLQQTASFMRRKKGVPDFSQSEPEFLVSCLDRHPDWAVVVCLVGGGQEINTGEAGIEAWLDAIQIRFPHWKVYMSPNLRDREFQVPQTKLERVSIFPSPELHLGVSMRSFRSERVSELVQRVLDIERLAASECLSECTRTYPIVLTRDISAAKDWLRVRARGTERTGIVVSSQAERLRPQGIHVKAPMNPVHWFLADKDDVRSSYYLEDVATEFHIQGLEIDWACLTWDADLRMTPKGWEYWSFKGDQWQRIRKAERQRYLLNAYRVLLTRARQGMVIVVPDGDRSDPTRNPAFYDSTYEYLADIGIPKL